VSTRDLIHMQPRLRSEKGQATTEFALILFPLLILVTGIIWFGIGLNYWLDMQRIANQLGGPR
jgi:Flp pilus assembly protein TadG